jgi:hypothetical protein
MKIMRHVRGNAVAYIALFAALGGSAVAASQIGSKDIKRDAVKAKHVKDGSLSAKEFADGSLPRGEQGIPGLQGEPGTDGERGPSDAYVIRDDSFSSANSISLNDLPAGDYVVDAKVSITNDQGPEEVKPSCSVGGVTQNDSGGDLSHTSLDSGTASDASETEHSLHAGVRLAEGGEIRMECFRPANAGVGFGRWSLIAVQVGEIHFQER